MFSRTPRCRLEEVAADLLGVVETLLLVREESTSCGSALLSDGFDVAVDALRAYTEVFMSLLTFCRGRGILAADAFVELLRAPFRLSLEYEDVFAAAVEEESRA